MRRLDNGFSLIELLVVLVILAILLSVALPSYQSHVAQGRLAQAKAALLENGHFMQRWYQQQLDDPYQIPSQWPSLPINETSDFLISFNSQAPSSDNIERSSFLLYARPKANKGLPEQLYFVLDQENNLRRCEPRRSDGAVLCEGAN